VVESNLNWGYEKRKLISLPPLPQRKITVYEQPNQILFAKLKTSIITDHGITDYKYHSQDFELKDCVKKTSVERCELRL